MPELVRQFITKQPCSARTVWASLWKVTAERQPSMLVQNRSLPLLAWKGLKKIHRKKLTKVWESPSTQRLKEKRKRLKVHRTQMEDCLGQCHFTLCRQRKRFWPNSWSVGLGIDVWTFSCWLKRLKEFGSPLLPISVNHFSYTDPACIGFFHRK